MKGSSKRVRDAVVLEVMSGTIKDTPVDTGRLRGNWQVSENFASRVSFPDARSEGSQVSQRIVERVKTFRAESDVFITNNLPYAGVLEFGDGKNRKPVAMLRKNVARVQRLVSKEARKEKAR